MGPYLGVLGHGVGTAAGGYIGSKLGGYIGGQSGEEIGTGIGSLLGGVGLGVAGSLAPTFKKGGRIKRTCKALLHKGEFILPRGIPPTKSQIKKVRKRGGRV